jgi:DNA-directed RNA polymerase subunit M/transcription elongation factor TFIIS
MITSAKNKEIDCIIVKDLSRLGRNFVKTEEYTQLIFPRLGIRFISISNDIDSLREKTFNERLATPFLNLANEVFVAETSHKIRISKDMRRRSGNFVKNYAEYGYIKKTKNSECTILEIDPDASKVIREIYQLKIGGFSNQAIAETLNNREILCPLEYKHLKGIPVSNSFQKYEKVLWNSVSVRRILENPVYIGTLEQGKTTTPSYKDKRRYVKDKIDWAIFEDAHEPIISELQFMIVSDLLGKDSYTTGKSVSYLFSGVTYCGNCGNVLYRRADKKPRYVCRNKECKEKRNINEFSLYESVFQTLKAHLRTVLSFKDYDEPLLPTEENIINEVNYEKIKFFDKEIKRILIMKEFLFSEKQKNIISEIEFQETVQFYDKKISDYENEKAEILYRKQRIIDRSDEVLENYRKYVEFTELTREILVTFIEKITIVSSQEITIFFRYADVFSENKNNNEE